MFYKIVSNWKIVDACTEIHYVRWQAAHQIFLSCDATWADGILTSDGAYVYLIEGADTIQDLPYATFSEITEEQYNEIMEELDRGDPIDDDTEPSGESEPVVKHELVERLESLEQQNEMLLECLLEMSEIVYA